MSYFYFDFRDANKQNWNDLLPSLLAQLAASSGPRSEILSDLYSAHDSGMKKPSDEALTRCLKEMLTLPEQRPIYIIIDALDECPNFPGIPSPRERVLQLVTQLLDLRLPNIHMCHKPPGVRHKRCLKASDLFPSVSS